MKIVNTLATRLRGWALVTAASVAFAFSLLGAAPPSALVGTGLLASAMSADAAVSFATAARNSRCTSLVTYAGSSAKLKVYNGTRPSGVGAVSGGNTLLASGTFGLTIGTCTGGVLAWDASGFTQTSSGFTAGTPAFFDITTSGDVVVARVDVCGSAPCWTFTGTVATGQNLTLTTLTFTEGNT